MSNPINFRRRVDCPYGGTTTEFWTDSNTIADVQFVVGRAKAANCDGFALRRTSPQINAILAGGTDKITWFLNECKARGMKFGLIIEPVLNISTGTGFNISASNQTAFLTMLVKILQKYPTLDFLEMEEPTYDTDDQTQALARQQVMNPYFQAIRNICNQYHPGLLLGFNAARVEYTWRGIDPAYIKANDVFDYFAAENYWIDLVTPTYQWATGGYPPTFEQYNAQTQAVMLGLPIFPWIATRNYNPTQIVTPYGIWNPGFFDEVKYCSDNNIPHGIFYDGDLDVPASYYPPNTIPGTDIKTKLNNISTGNIILPPPSAPVLGSIQFSPPPVVTTMTIGESLSFLVVCKDTNGAVLTCPVLTPHSSNMTAAIAAMTTSALGQSVQVAGIGSGSTDISVSSGNITSLPLTITVLPAPCVSSGYACEQPLNGWKVDNCGNRVQDSACNPLPVLSVINLTPALASIIVGQELVIKAQAFDSNNLPMSGVPIVWSESSGKLGIIPVNTSTFTDGTVSTTIKGLAVGTVQLQATSNNVVATAIVDINYSNPTSPCGVIGDVDMDGVITQADVDLAKTLIGSPNITVDQIRRIDVNGNGLADTQDIQMLQDFVDGKITTFPACKTVSFSLGDIAPIALLAAAVMALFSKKR